MSVPLVAAAVCPHPPLLVPEVASGSAAEMDACRAACDEALARLLAPAPATVVVVGSGPSTRAYPPPYHASFVPWGADVGVGPGEPLPLSLSVGVWLARRSPDAGSTIWSAYSVATDATPAACATLAAELDRAGPWALLVMGDGSACRGPKAPGYDDARAEPFDRSVAEALATADLDALRKLDPALAAVLRAAGRAPWQVLAAAAERDGPWRAELLHDAAPYGVAYFVASWVPS